MLPSHFELALLPPVRPAFHGRERQAREHYDALSPRAQAALRGLWLHRKANAVRAVGPREYAVLRAIQSHDTDAVLAAVRSAMLAPLAPAA